MENTEKKMTFETALARLEEIVRAMESGSAKLDESLALFEEGVGLVKFCTGELDNAEQRVRFFRRAKKEASSRKILQNPNKE